MNSCRISFGMTIGKLGLISQTSGTMFEMSKHKRGNPKKKVQKNNVFFSTSMRETKMSLPSFFSTAFEIRQFTI